MIAKITAIKRGFLVVLALAAGCVGPTGVSIGEQVAAVNACKSAGGKVEEIRYADGNGLAKVNCYLGGDQMTWKERQAKPCIDKGGVPIFSSWDGSLKDCKFKEEK